MGNVTFIVDKDNTFNLVNQLTTADKKELVEQLKNDGTGTASAISKPTSDAKEYLELVRKVHDYGQEEYDKNILYISSSALGLTLAFIDKIVKLNAAIYKWNLWTGWLLLGSTILLYVVSHLISAHVQRLLITKVEAAEKNNVLKVREDTDVKSVIKNGSNFISVINWFLYLGMTIGIISIMKFLYHNLLN
jgi:thiosulfate reductase cytochrome b subunit